MIFIGVLVHLLYGALHFGAYLELETERESPRPPAPMFRLEAVRTELEAVVERRQHLAENAKLREAQPELAEGVDQAVEADWLEELYVQALRDI